MLERTCSWPFGGMPAAPVGDRDLSPGVPTPRYNGLLASLPLPDYERLRIHLQPLALPRGWVIHRAGDPEEGLYFITSGLVSRLYLTRSGASVEFAVTGREGVIGMASFLGGGSTPSQAVVLQAGHAYRLPGGALKRELDREGALVQMLLRYTQALMAQTAQVAMCARHHSLEQRLCRWLLSCLDRMQANGLPMTQALVAALLGVRRQSVAQACARLQELGLIRYSRGRIVVRDRAGLEAHACECYAVVRREYDRLLPGFTAAARPAR